MNPLLVVNIVGNVLGGGRPKGIRILVIAGRVIIAVVYRRGRITDPHLIEGFDELRRLGVRGGYSQHGGYGERIRPVSGAIHGCIVSWAHGCSRTPVGLTDGEVSIASVVSIRNHI